MVDVKRVDVSNSQKDNFFQTSILKLKINYDTKKPDGMPRKCLDISLAKKYGWKPKNNYLEGFKLTFQHFLKNHHKNEKNK